MNFQNEIETLIRARYPILYVITSEEMRVQKILVEIAGAAAEEGVRVDLQLGHRAGGSFDPVPEGPEPGHQGAAGGAGPGDRAGRAGDLPVQGFPSVPDAEQLCRHPPAQGHRAASEEQPEDDRADFAGDGDSGGAGQGDHGDQFSRSRARRTWGSCWTRRSRTCRSRSRCRWSWTGRGGSGCCRRRWG